MVQRWDIGRDRGLGVFMEHDEFGEYVELKDYYALEERLAALEVMIDAAKLAGCTFVQKAPYTESSVECWVHDAERDRLAAENAELRKQCAAFHTEASDHYRAFLAATATLDRLREVVRSDDDEWQDWEPGDLMRLASAVHAILYPQPENES